MREKKARERERDKERERERESEREKERERDSTEHVFRPVKYGLRSFAPYLQSPYLLLSVPN